MIIGVIYGPIFHKNRVRDNIFSMTFKNILKLNPSFDSRKLIIKFSN